MNYGGHPKAAGFRGRWYMRIGVLVTRFWVIEVRNRFGGETLGKEESILEKEKSDY
jgi:hypothetical protein